MVLGGLTDEFLRSSVGVPGRAARATLLGVRSLAAAVGIRHRDCGGTP